MFSLPGLRDSDLSRFVGDRLSGKPFECRLFWPIDSGSELSCCRASSIFQVYLGDKFSSKLKVQTCLAHPLLK